MPFFSIILPTYNRASFLKRSIGSVLAQTFADWELIVMDDGSRDQTKEVVTSFKDPRIRYFYQENRERSAARNNGIARAKGEYICFLDSDDAFMADHLEVFQSRIITGMHVPAIFVAGIQVQHEDGVLFKRDFLDESKSMLIEIGEKFIIPSQVCAHASVFDQNLFYEQTRIWEDTHLWLRLAAQFAVIQTKSYTVTQHVHANGTVFKGLQRIRWTDVMQYLNAIDDLKRNYRSLFEGKLPTGYFKEYKKAKKTAKAEDGGEVCHEDILMQMLKNGNTLLAEDFNADETYTLTLESMYFQMSEVPANTLLEMINERDDADTSDIILQVCFIGEHTYG